jgi:hypothetical protein
MGTPEDPISDLINTVKQQRDELEVKMHLAKAEAREEWEKLEGRWNELRTRAEPLTSAVDEAADVAGEQAKKVAGAALDVAARELKESYDRLKKLLQ